MLMIPNILVDHLCGAENSLPSPGSRQCDTKQPLLGRAMLIGRPCLVFECLREAMNLRGIETHACRFEKPFSLSVSEYGYDILVIFVMRGESRDRQMIAELRSHVPHAPAVALVEDPNAEAASFCGRGFSTVILGLPSVSFAVGVVQLLLLGSRHLRECHRSDRDLQSHSAHQENFDREPDAGMPDICFTPRELDLLDLLRRGMQNKLIAYELGISQSTVKAHLRSIMQHHDEAESQEPHRGGLHAGSRTNQGGHPWLTWLRGFSLCYFSCSDAAMAAMKTVAAPGKPPHHLLIQVNQNDPGTMNLALNNATNVIEYYNNPITGHKR